MTKNLLIVESPAKAKTIKKYLGENFEVLASYGHVRDLIPKEGAVDPEHGFAMNYEIVEKNLKHVLSIAKVLKKSDVLFLATDPDREGEAIAWHILELMRAKKALLKKPVYRVVFHEITRDAVQQAVANPRQISMNLVNAQQARRALDFLVGFNLSPLLWRKIRKGLSAGRVQSPALRLIAEREKDIQKFVTQEYWTIQTELDNGQQVFSAKLAVYAHQKLEQFSIINETDAKIIEQSLAKIGNLGMVVTAVEKKKRKRHPAPPFITSTLQQEAARKLGFTADRTMRLAQQLYEGISLGKEGATGLISYMRTDSVSLATEAIQQIRTFIIEKYGEKNAPTKPKIYKVKSKNAQEAHEAIRPTDIRRAPETLEGRLNNEQAKLYELIWKRTVACQMIPATLDTVAVDIACGEGNSFHATGSVIIDLGFMRVYQEDVDDASNIETNITLPPLAVGETLSLVSIESVQHFTEPPPRFTEASLVKALEEYDIGRPSTYASILYTLKYRGYVTVNQKRFTLTDVGSIVSQFLTTYFNQYVDYHFTAKLEDSLDSIARGECIWTPMLADFWYPFKEKVQEIQTTVKRSDVTQEIIAENCPKCGQSLSMRLGKRGRFIGCTSYPDCDYTRTLEGEEINVSEPDKVLDRVCSHCQSVLHIKMGRYGKFIGCSNYPKCKHMEPLEKPEDVGITCPECQKGHLLKRKSRYNTAFYSCETYPVCKYAVWNTPLLESCPQCHWPILTLKETKRWGKEKVCPQKECAFKQSM